MIRLVDPNNLCIGYTCALKTRYESILSEKYVTRGKWYYEVESINGSLRYLVGFSDISQITFYNSLNKSLLFYYAPISSKYKAYGSLNFKTNFTRIGVGIDADNNIFYIQTQEEYRQIPFSINYAHPKWKVHLYEATDESNPEWIDYVQLSFTRDSFVYDIPIGFTAFGEVMKIVSCPVIFYNSINKLLYLVFIFLTSE